MPKIIDIETKKEILNLYKSGVEIKMIANLQGVSSATVGNLIKKEVISGELVARREKYFGTHRPPKGCGRGEYIKKGRNPKRKLTPEQEHQLLIDYFENDMTYKQIMDKYDLWQASIKRIVDDAIKKNLYKPKGKGNHKKAIERRF